ncbi:MAG: hypothetical protein KZQ81_19245 [Candidatus Thiodiazotropha sp. (ex Rostrolucina anterorostrata)]|nr:hypothetical protein [Candidatus Thiodiazotropha sp. (ex Rostrolucina anterorostrata)]
MDISLSFSKNCLKNSEGVKVGRYGMEIEGMTASYDYTIPKDEQAGNWKFKCVLEDRLERVRKTSTFAVSDSPIVVPVPTDPPPVDPPVDPPPVVDPPIDGPIAAHNTITEYNGPATSIGCHQTEATEMLQSLHMQWSGPTPDLSNTNGQGLGKGDGGINTFCTYAMSSKGACFSCHVRADGNAPDAVKAEDVRVFKILCQ